jgi:hypothetical protein
VACSSRSRSIRADGGILQAVGGEDQAQMQAHYSSHPTEAVSVSKVVGCWREGSRGSDAGLADVAVPATRTERTAVDTASLLISTGTAFASPS